MHGFTLNKRGAVKEAATAFSLERKTSANEEY
jgi:hypothetical protein